MKALDEWNKDLKKIDVLLKIFELLPKKSVAPPGMRILRRKAPTLVRLGGHQMCSGQQPLVRVPGQPGPAVGAGGSRFRR